MAPRLTLSKRRVVNRKCAATFAVNAVSLMPLRNGPGCPCGVRAGVGVVGVGVRGRADQAERRTPLMDIGTEGTPYVIEPIVEPVPGRVAEPAPVEPDYQPEPAPVREPEKVPA